MGAPAEEFGQYLVYEQIGLGGMATVHRAETTGIAGFRRPVALKRMLPHVAANADLVKSFVREARLASHLRHENVAQTLDLGKVGDIYFIAMELVLGRTLREILKHCVAVTGPMPLPVALNILSQICDALDYAHNLCDETGQALGIIHRDVSPSNVIVSEGGVVKLIDFGIAKASAQGMQTLSGTIKGKFGYMAPEYLAGQIDARVDLFALGVVAHEVLTNRPLFQGKDDMETLYRIKSMPVPLPSSLNPQIPPEIDSIVMTALERDPDTRWQRANAMRTALTTEIKRLGLTAHNNQVVEWIEWAFQQGKRTENSTPSISISSGETHPVIKAQGSEPGADDLEKTRLVLNAGPRRTTQHVVERVRRSSQEPVARSSAQQPIVNRPASAPSAPPPLRPGSSSPPPMRSPTPSMPVRPASPSAPPPGITDPLPLGPVPSGARTLQMPMKPIVAAAPAAPIDAHAATQQAEAKTGHKAEVARTRVAKPRRGRGILVAVLVLLAAVGTAAVVYFALPYFT